MTGINHDALAALEAATTGPVFTRADSAYRDEITAFDLTLKHSPELVIGAATADDVSVAVRFAVEHSLPFQVQATGHGVRVAQQSGLLITTRRLNELTISVAERRAVIGAGVRWGEVVAAAAPLGLLPVTGANPAVGVVGFLLGGGIGPLGRTFGAGSDWVRSINLVTATGDHITANSTTNPELLWASRGGAGGIGIVTSVEIELVPVPTLYAGGLYFAEPHLDVVFRAWRDWSASLPEEVTTSIAVLAFPPLEFIPEVFRGRRVAHVRFAATLDAVTAEQLLEPLRNVAPVYFDAVGRLPLDRVAEIHNEPTEPGEVYGKARFFADLSTHSINAIVAAAVPAENGPIVPFVAVEVRRLGGALARDVPEGSAVGARAAEFSVMVVGLPTGACGSAIQAASDRLFTAIEPDRAEQTSVNFIDHSASEAEFDASWSTETATRLRALRAEWDPTGMFAPLFSAP
jgi:FAD/FMN-containing dehydrogenase